MPLPRVERLDALTATVCADVRRRFTDAGFDQRLTGVAADGPAALFEALRFPLARAILEARGDAGARLAILFAFAGDVPADRARDDLGPIAADALLEAGVLESRGGTVRSAYRVTPFEGLWIFTDHLASGSDTVMIPGATTGRVASLLPRSVRGALLDVGCGHGLLTLVAARRGASPAVGADLNERAIALARFNARFNDVTAEFTPGDRTAPVRDRRFDLVVAQPPYVVRPPGSVDSTYMHGGALGDEIALKFLEAIPPVLARGGRALVCFDSAVRPDRSHTDLVRAALGDADVDVVLLLEQGAPPEHQAIAYAAVEAPDLGASFGDVIRKYHRHFLSVGSPPFKHVVAVLRPRPADATRPPFTIELEPDYLHGATSTTIDALLAALDLAASDDATLLGAAVRASPCTRWVDERPQPDPQLAPVRSVRFGAGTVGTNRAFDERGYAIVSALDRAASVSQGIEAAAAALGTSTDTLRADVLAFVRQALACGLLEPRSVTGR